MARYNNGYYDNNVLLCPPCSVICETCVTTADNCLSCYASQFRQLVGNECLCLFAYYIYEN